MGQNRKQGKISCFHLFVYDGDYDCTVLNATDCTKAVA